MQDVIDRFDGEYKFLSNFYPSVVLMEDGQQAPTIEHAFQASKTVISAERELVLRCATPGQAKRRGRGVTLRLNWENLKEQIMVQLIIQKFAPGTELAAKLVATGDAVLIEGNCWGDIYWGAVKDNKTGLYIIGKTGWVLSCRHSVGCYSSAVLDT